MFVFNTYRIKFEINIMKKDCLSSKDIQIVCTHKNVLLSDDVCITCRITYQSFILLCGTRFLELFLPFHCCARFILVLPTNAKYSWTDNTGIAAKIF